MARKRRDPLRTTLDQLAQQIADAARKDTELTFSQKVSALKVAGAYMALSRKQDGPERSDSAWENYSRQILGNGLDEDAAEDAA